MDDTVNNFLNEINEIVPPVKKKTECAWQECFDDKSGFSYYWNVNTNEVTWEMPADYKNWLQAPKTTTSSKPPVLPKLEPLFPGVSINAPPDTVKIYKLQQDVQKVGVNSSNSKSVVQKPLDRENDEDKPKLISGYGGDSESDNEESVVKSRSNSPAKSQKSACNSKSNSRKNSDEEDNGKTDDILLIKEKPTLGFALVAGYGDDTDEEEEPPPPKSKESSPKIAHSTLFPITKPIDVSQFMESKECDKLDNKENIDTKAFQRKRRLGVNLVNVPRKRSDDELDDEFEHKGLGFKSETGSNATVSSSGGIAFVKAETLNPASQNATSEEAKSSKDATQGTLKEKLLFLSEGREKASPVQIMLIQLETLDAALKSGDLTISYFTRWINEMCDELIKLEEDAAPNGWHLEWDRLQKRYYYRNKSTDECQWDYPQSVDDDAMDICTTPPPQEDVLSSARNTPSPPPPPKIDGNELLSKNEKGDLVHANSQDNSNSNLNLALDSFYSDLAAIENSNTTADSSNSQTDEKKTQSIDNTSNGEPPIKKKKKVKMGQGISMKNKGVGQLVEKWKNVQKNLD